MKSARKPAFKPAKDRPPVRVRYDPPTLEEAVFAAQGLTEDLKEQAEIAACLMDVAPDDVRPLILKAAAQKAAGTRLIVSSRPGAQRTVVVERTRTFRRPGALAPLRPFGRTLG
ncbi:MAG TPA: hypothetical protein VND97_03405 [Beijerinckiaceae bacterium]|nr:hypothetical protein [Beijerinckiaceae bacterium]